MQKLTVKVGAAGGVIVCREPQNVAIRNVAHLKHKKPYRGVGDPIAGYRYKKPSQEIREYQRIRKPRQCYRTPLLDDFFEEERA